MLMKNIAKFLNKKKLQVYCVGIVALFLHVLFFQSVNSLMILPFLFYWIVIGILCKIDERFFFGIALVFLTLSVPPFLQGNLDLAEKLSIWEYLFLVLGVTQWLLFDVLFPNARK